MLAGQPYADRDGARSPRADRGGPRAHRRGARPGAVRSPADRRAGRRAVASGSSPASTRRRRHRGAAGGRQRGVRGALRPGLPDPRGRPGRRGDPGRARPAAAATTTRPSAPRPSTTCARSRCSGSKEALLMSTLSTHVLDTAAGPPADRRPGPASRPAPATPLDEGVTDARRPDRRRSAASSAAGDYVLRFDTAAYYGQGFFPEVVVVFTIADERPPPRAAAAQPLRLLDLPWQLTLDLVLRARRAVVGGRRGRGLRGHHRRADRRRHAVRRPAGRGAHRRPRRRRGAAARPGRHPRPRQRARPHRVGGLRHRDPRGRGRRRHHDRGHAAQLGPADHDGRQRWTSKRAVAEGQVRVDVGFWGGAVPGNLADLEPLHEAGVFGFKCFLLDSGVEEFAAPRAGRVRRGDARDRAASAR